MSRKVSQKCENCIGLFLVEDETRGEWYCEDCGLIQPLKSLDRRPSREKGEPTKAHARVTFSSRDAKGKLVDISQLRRFKFTTRRVVSTGDERKRGEIYGRIRGPVSSLGYGSQVSERAEFIFHRVRKKLRTNHDYLIAAAVYMACRELRVVVDMRAFIGQFFNLKQIQWDLNDKAVERLKVRQKRLEKQHIAGKIGRFEALWSEEEDRRLERIRAKDMMGTTLDDAEEALMKKVKREGKDNYVETKKRVIRYYKRIKREEGLAPEPVTAEDFIPFLGARVREAVKDSANNKSEKRIRLLHWQIEEKAYEYLRKVGGSTPNVTAKGQATAAIFLATIYHDAKVAMNEVATKVGMSSQTVKRHVVIFSVALDESWSGVTKISREDVKRAHKKGLFCFEHGAVIFRIFNDEARILEVLGRYGKGGEFDINEIAEELGMTTAWASQLIPFLQREGRIEKLFYCSAQWDKCDSYHLSLDDAAMCNVECFRDQVRTKLPDIREEYDLYESCKCEFPRR